MIAIDGVGEYGDDHVVLAEPIPLRRLDGPQHVAHPGDAEGLCHEAHALLGYAVPVDHRLPARLLREQLQPLLGLDVVNAHDGIHVHHVMDPRDVLISDALNIVAPVTVPEDGRTLDGLQPHDLVVGPPLLQAVPCGDGPPRTHGRDVCGHLPLADASLLQFPGQFDDRVPGDVIVEAVVAHHLELIQYAHALNILRLQLLALIVDLLDIGFAPRGEDQSGAIAPHQFEPLDAHLLREDDDGVEVHSAADPGPADAIVARRGPDQGVDGRIHLPIELLLDEYRIRRPHFVAAGGEILAVQHNDRSLHVSQLGRQNLVVDAVLMVSPGDVVQVDGIERILFHHLVGLGAHPWIDLPRMEHLFERGSDHQLVRLGHGLLLVITNDNHSRRRSAAMLGSMISG